MSPERQAKLFFEVPKRPDGAKDQRQDGGRMNQQQAKLFLLAHKAWTVTLLTVAIILFVGMTLGGGVLGFLLGGFLLASTAGFILQPFETQLKQFVAFIGNVIFWGFVGYVIVSVFRIH